MKLAGVSGRLFFAVEGRRGEDNVRGDEILGSWMSGGWRIRMEIGKDEKGFFGVLAEGLENGEKDAANPDPDKRGRTLLGIRLFEGMEYRSGVWSGGKIYDPESGRRYSLRLSIAEGGQLDMRAYLGLRWIGMSQTWERSGDREDLRSRYMEREAGLEGMASWKPEKAWNWHRSTPWPVGCNYIPSNAVNQIDMWQAAFFDPRTICRELSWARDLGFNCQRVYLHDLLWKREGRAFLDRVSRFLDIAHGRGLRTVFVLFDDCWNDGPRYGKQPGPKPGVHNSRWLRSPGSEVIIDQRRWPYLEEYLTAVISRFKDDGRVLAWDLYNEIGNSADFLPNSTRLLARTFSWARRAGPSQPLTAGVWKRASWFAGVNEFLIQASDIVSFHDYSPLEGLRSRTETLAAYGKPLLCTEYMARSQGSLFSTHLPFLKERGIGALSWGLVAGKSQTIYPWGSRRGAKEPDTWFHDILRADGSPYDRAEAQAIKGASGR